MMKSKYRLSLCASAITLALFSLTTLAQENETTGNKKQYPKEFEEAILLESDLENGKKLYRNCVTCHGPEGWGTRSGSYPQIAGQLRSVIIKQLADFRAGNRDNPIMRAFSSRKALGNAQDIADVAGYIANLPMTLDIDTGPRLADLESGAAIYKEMCAKCHGDNGEGDPKDHGPALYAQHFSYLKRQFDWIRNGRRRNADEKMTKQIQNINTRDEIDVLAYTSNLKPPREKIAEQGWTNPDFPSFVRSGSFRNINN